MKVHLSLAAYPRHSPFEAMARATYEKTSEPLLGQLSLDHVQVCPQNSGYLSEQRIIDLVDAFPDTRFRPHANVRVEHLRQVCDLDTFDKNSSWWKALKRCCELMGAPAYTAHAGLRSNNNLAGVLGNTLRAEDFLGIPVGIEGHYPTPRNIYLLDSWQDYWIMLKSGVHYAVDLSHLQILAHQTGVRDMELIAALLNSEQCIEVHVSDNDGKRDAHQLLNQEPWWWSLLQHAHPNAIIFSEGTQPQ